MDEARFWALIDQARTESAGDVERQMVALENALAAGTPQDVIAFGEIFDRLMGEMYTWDLWAAAYVLLDGCSDDGFIDFRYWVISRGRDAVHAATTDPDSLAQFITDPDSEDNGSAEAFGYAAMQAYERLTGESLPPNSVRWAPTPAGDPFDEDDFEALAQRFPRLNAIAYGS